MVIFLHIEIESRKLDFCCSRRKSKETSSLKQRKLGQEEVPTIENTTTEEVAEIFPLYQPRIIFTQNNFSAYKKN